MYLLKLPTGIPNAVKGFGFFWHGYFAKPHSFKHKLLPYSSLCTVSSLIYPHFLPAMLYQLYQHDALLSLNYWPVYSSIPRHFFLTIHIRTHTYFIKDNRMIYYRWELKMAPSFQKCKEQGRWQVGRTTVLAVFHSDSQWHYTLAVLPLGSAKMLDVRIPVVFIFP